MTAIFGILAIIGCCGVPLTAVNLMIRKVREKPVRKTGIILGIMLACLILGTAGVNLL